MLTRLQIIIGNHGFKTNLIHCFNKHTNDKKVEF